MILAGTSQAKVFIAPVVLVFRPVSSLSLSGQVAEIGPCSFGIFGRRFFRGTWIGDADGLVVVVRFQAESLFQALSQTAHDVVDGVQGRGRGGFCRDLTVLVPGGMLSCVSLK
jgi:hypothetical protein